MRGGRKPVATGPEMVGIADLGACDRQTVEPVVRDHCGRAQLASILHRMWVCETDFHVGFGAKVTQRLRLKPAQ